MGAPPPAGRGRAPRRGRLGAADAVPQPALEERQPDGGGGVCPLLVATTSAQLCLPARLSCLEASVLIADLTPCSTFTKGA